MLNAFDAFVAAQEYEEAAHHLMIMHLPYFLESDPESTRDERPILSGEIAAMVTNMAFSVELLVKCLYVLNNPGSSERLGHDLRGIFDKLPNRVRAEVAKKYASEIGDKTHLWVIEPDRKRAFPDMITVAYNDPTYQDDLGPTTHVASLRFTWTHEDSAGLSIEEVLDENAQAFVDFRYSWENWESSEPRDLSFDVLRVHMVIKVLKEGIIAFTPLGRYKLRYKQGEKVGEFQLISKQNRLRPRNPRSH